MHRAPNLPPMHRAPGPPAMHSVRKPLPTRNGRKLWQMYSALWPQTTLEARRSRSMRNACKPPPVHSRPPAHSLPNVLAPKRYPNLCLGIQNNSSSDGASVEQRTCSNAANQLWTFQDMGGG